jgi:hypothetical protein
MNKYLHVSQMLQAALIGTDVIPAPLVSQLLCALELPALRTYAMTDAMIGAGFGRIERPRLHHLKPHKPGECTGRSDAARTWHVPGIGACTVYVRDTSGDAVCNVRAYGQTITMRGHAAAVFAYIQHIRELKPDGRVTRFEDNPGRRTLARAALREQAYLNRVAESKGKRQRATICRVCNAAAPKLGHARCVACIMAWRLVHDYPKQRRTAPSDASAPVIPLGRKRALARQTARIESERQVAEGRAFAADLARRRAAGEAIPPPVKPYWVSDNDT